MAYPNRKDVRSILGALLEDVLVGAGLPAQALYDHKVADFQGQSPVVVVTSDGSERPTLSFGNELENVFYFMLHVFVIYSDEGTWTEADSEDALDDIERVVADFVVDNYSNATWKALGYADRTQIDDVVIGGSEYKHEIIPLVLEVY